MGEFLQKQFDQFHKKIKQDNYDALREKRKLLIDELRDWLKNNDKPGFDEFNQGSYAMKTTIEPLSGEDFDIDVGVEFRLSIKDYEPIEVKQWVFDAFTKRANRTVEFRTACVRVQYVKDGEPRFHLDFAVYGREDDSKPKENLFLAKGKPSSNEKNKKWESANPFDLKDKVNDAFEDVDEQLQMRRCIRAMKRWKDNKFSDGDGRPTGIAMTACALKWFNPYIYDQVSQDTKISDLMALRDLVEKMINNNYGLDACLPVEPHNDLFSKMKNSDKNVGDYKKRLENLRDALNEANSEEDAHKASIIIEKHFGADFPIPEKEEPRKSARPAIAPSIGSA